MVQELDFQEPPVAETPLLESKDLLPPGLPSEVSGDPSRSDSQRSVSGQEEATTSLAPVLGDPAAAQTELSRRQFLSGTLAGGAAGLAVAAGTGVGAWKIMDARAQAELDVAQREIERLRGLLKLYEELEKVGLDAILHTGMLAVALPLEGLERGALVLKRGLDIIEGSLLSIQESLPDTQEAMIWLEDRVADLAEGVGRLEQALGKALDRAGENPFVQAMEDLVNLVLDRLPLGLGNRIRDALEAVVQVLTSVDDTISGINTSVLVPLREKWFSTQEGKGVGAALIDPLILHVLDPLEAHLASLASLVDAWQSTLMAPAQAALEQRARVRESMSQYEAEHSTRSGTSALWPGGTGL
jgi:hypothetical protein